jgi:tRNA modification GTPase
MKRTDAQQISNSYHPDVITAIATAAGEGGIGIVRLSGADALRVADKIFRSPHHKLPSQQPGYTAQYGIVIDPRTSGGDADGRKIDEAVLLVMRGPKSYTCEDTVEINCHGGRAATQKVLEVCLAAGARIAEPGEFTKRAFLNGRIDLVQAETVLEVIRAKTDKSLEAAQRQLQGDLSVRVRALRDGIAHLLSHIEASLDFPDDKIEPMQMKELTAKTAALVKDLEVLARYGRHARWLKDGLRVVLTGEPNVGKSSLMNRIAQKERVIVSPHPGTTRDTVEETVEIAGYPIALTDTAGIRVTEDPIESQSVDRSRRAVEEADLVLFVADASRLPSPEEAAYWASLSNKPRRLILNKSDAASTDAAKVYSSWCTAADSSRTSCKTGEGIEALTESISRFIRHEIPEKSDELWVYSVRQQALFQNAVSHAADALKAFESGLSFEFPASDLRLSMDSLGEIVGAVVTDDILDLVFSQFCIGK